MRFLFKNLISLGVSGGIEFGGIYCLIMVLRGHVQLWYLPVLLVWGARQTAAFLMDKNRSRFVSRWDEPEHTLISQSDRMTADEEWCRRNGVRYDKNDKFAYVDDIVKKLIEEK